MTSSKLQSVGRLHYIEPNNVYNQIPNGIPHPYEDYCISVDFTVEFGSRNSFGPVGYNGAGNQNDLHFSSDNGTINFIGGTNGFLTTNFTDIESANPDKNTNECLGIESIDISYNNWYIPTVMIRFVDVRGASLMGKQEQGYLTTIKGETKGTGTPGTTIEGGSFFKALFSFPYPMFKLKVKGFYGKEVTYNLSVEDFRANFNAETGNFEIDAKFIGYMFGVYTDIPMNYLMIAPFIEDYGTNYWENSNFKYLDNATKILTYPELARYANTMMEATSDDEMGDESFRTVNENIKNLGKEIEGMTNLQGYLDSFLEETFSDGEGGSSYVFIRKSYGKVKPSGCSDDRGYYLCGVSRKNDIVFNSDQTSRSRWQRVTDRKGKKVQRGTYTYLGLIQAIKQFNDLYNFDFSTELNSLGFTGDSQKPLEINNSGKKDRAEIIKDIASKLEGRMGGSGTTATIIGHDGVIHASELAEYLYDNFIDGMPSGKYYIYIPQIIDSKGKYCATTVPLWFCDMYAEINKKLAEKKEEEDVLNRVLKVRVAKNLGFNPTIGNAFRMAFAHMDTFMEVFNSYLREIRDMKGTHKRSLKTLQVSVQNTDLPQTFNESGNVPPFTMFYKESTSEGQGGEGTTAKNGRKKTPIWPGSLPGDTSGLVEIEFVNKLIEAAKGYSEIWDKEYNAKSGVGEEEPSENYLPLTHYDLLWGGSNPYTYLANDLSYGNNMWDSMLLTLIMRLHNWHSMSGLKVGVDDDEKKICGLAGKIEAKNFHKAYPKLPLPIKENLRRYRDAGHFRVFWNNIRDYFLFGKSKGKVFDIAKQDRNEKITETGIYTREASMSYQWITLGDDKIFPVGNGNPADIDIRNKKKCVAIGKSAAKENIGLLETNVVMGAAVEAQPPTDSELECTFRGNAKGVGLNNVDAKRYSKKILHNIGHANKYWFSISKLGLNNTPFLGKNTYAYDEVRVNGTGYYFNSPSQVRIVNNENDALVCELYGHPLFYKQNDITDRNRRLMAKAFLFCRGLAVKFAPNGETAEEVNKDSYCNAMALWEGALWYEYKYRCDHPGEQLIDLPEGYKTAEIFRNGERVDEFYSFGSLQYVGPQQIYDNIFTVIETSTDKAYAKITDIKGDRTEDEKRTLADYFENWAKTVFPEFNKYFELDLTYMISKISGDTSEKTSYYGMLKAIEYIGGLGKKKYQFVDLFSKHGATTPADDTGHSFYYAPSEIGANNVKNNALHFKDEVQKTSDVQESLIKELLAKQVIYLDSSKISETYASSSLEESLKGFYDEMLKLYKEQLNTEDTERIKRNEEVDDVINIDDLKLSTYMTLKNLYDRWICMNRNPNKWKLGSEKGVYPSGSEFQHFKFIDSFYHNIEEKLNVNTESILDTASELMATSNINNSAVNMKYIGQSFYEFMASICQKNEMIFLTLPMENEFVNPQGIADLFDVLPYSKMDERDTSCYVALYTNRASQYLNVAWDDPEYMYATDGFNISNAMGEVVEVDLIPQLAHAEDGDYEIPAFGVSYAKQNQSIFKRVSVNMQNPQVTEASIAATQAIASKMAEGGRQTVLYGQDLYRVYANYSYTCVVEMMGDAQIMPLTYFQLNNIPLFRGTYLIIKIEHHIKAGDMTTVFTGVRMSKYDMPLVSDEELLINIERRIHAKQEEGEIDKSGTEEAIEEKQQQERTTVNTTTQRQQSQGQPSGTPTTTPTTTITIPAITFPYALYTHSDRMNAYNASHAGDPLNNDPRKLYDRSWTSSTTSETGEIIVITGDTTANTRVMLERKVAIQDLNALATRVNEIQAAWRTFCGEYASRKLVVDSQGKTVSGEKGFDWTDFTEIKITSGFRSITKNRAGESVNHLVGGIKRSAHSYGLAVDMVIKKPDVNGQTGEIANRMDSRALWTFFWFIERYHRKNNLSYGRILNEADATNWVHYAIKDRFRNINKISIVLDKSGAKYKIKINSQRPPKEDITLTLSVSGERNPVTAVLKANTREVIVTLSTATSKAKPTISCTSVSPEADDKYVYGKESDYMQINGSAVSLINEYPSNCEIAQEHYETPGKKIKYRDRTYSAVDISGRDKYLWFIDANDR